MEDPMKKINDIEQFDNLLTSVDKFVVYKHSSTCSLSATAESEIYNFLAETAIENIYKVLVIEQRPLSNHIAEVLGIGHHSPQILIVRNGKCIDNFSHQKITKDSLKKRIMAPSSS